ncbi:T9SS type A sorting domain-containing protein, partial [bacterium]|nr:T9SS type A sorting domain-containing protein [bacterium]
PVILDGGSYDVLFYADLNGNGGYDDPPADHSWMLDADNVSGNTTLNFSHNTNFTPIDWNYAVTMNFNGMTPHLNQLLEIRIIDSVTELEVGRKRVEIVPAANFSVVIPGLTRNGSYRADFYADLNGNGRYNNTPTDHAWSMNFSNPDGNVTLDFTHNTNFTNIDWEYLFRLNMLGMNPHLGQLLEMRLVDNSDAEIGRTKFVELAVANSALSIPGLMQTADYHADFYADLNGSGDYNPPPADHAWRQEFTSDGDVVMNFAHNTNFVDIEWPTLAAGDPVPFELLPTSVSLFQNYPNPFNPSTSISFNLPQAGFVRLEVFNSLGQSIATLIDGNLAAGLYNHEFTGAGLSSGVYFYQLRAGEQVLTRRMMLLK